MIYACPFPPSSARNGAVRPHLRVRKVLLLLAMASPALLHAQFQQPTAEELKMTADPKAPGAAAVYLYREDVTDDPDNLHSYYDRIKVLTEKGKELATVRIPYEHGVERVTEIRGRTIHADGTIIPFKSKPSDLMDFKGKNLEVNTLTFTLPSAEVGSILEYRLEFSLPVNRVSEPTWNIQQGYFVHKEHFGFTHAVSGINYVKNSQGRPLDRLLYSSRLPQGAKVVFDRDKALFSIDLTDVPPVPEEDWMPPINTLNWRVEFYYTDTESGAKFWEDAGKRWAKEALEFTGPSGFLAKAVAGIVAPTDTDEQKAQRIYAAVEKLDNTDFSREKSEVERKREKLKAVHRAEDVWKQQSGSGNELALLYVALARTVGLKVWPVQVVNRNRAIFDLRYLSLSQLDDYLVVSNIGGREVYLDPGQRMCPYGTLHWKHTFASGFRLTGSGAVHAITPGSGSESEIVQRVADLTVDEQGNLKGTARFTMAGQEALHWRQLALENDQEEVKKQFIESLRDDLPDGVNADFDHFLALDDYTANLIGIVRISGSLGTATGKRFFLPGLFFESQAKHPFVAQDKRLTPIDLHYARTEQDDVTYHLPSGFNVESVPKTADLSWPGYAALRINSSVDNGSVKVVRSFARNFALLDPKVYNDLHDFYLKVAAADQQQLVLTRAAAAKGN